VPGSDTLSVLLGRPDPVAERTALVRLDSPLWAPDRCHSRAWPSLIGQLIVRSWGHIFGQDSRVPLQTEIAFPRSAFGILYSLSTWATS
jgi:hypothetical protein